VTRLGAQTSIPARGEVDERLLKWSPPDGPERA
jgi:hypothetical protein